MSKLNAVFTFEGTDVTIECLKEEKMRDICQRYAKKIEYDISKLSFMYEDKELNLGSSVEEQTNFLDKSNNIMKIKVSKKEDDGYICPKCGEKIKLNSKILANIISTNTDIIDNLLGTKLIIENIIKTSQINLIIAQLKNIKAILNAIDDDMKKNNEKLKNLLNNKSIVDNIMDNTDIINMNDFKNKSIIKGVINLELNDLKKNIYLFKSEYYYGIDLYINGKKVLMKKDRNANWVIDKNCKLKPGKSVFLMVFNDTLIDMEEFFGECPYIISLDFSNFDSSDVTNMRILFNKCQNLKVIKGLDQLNTNKVIDMEGIFQYCTELEYLDLSNFDTSNVINMAFMFNQCNNLKEIKGLNKFITNKVTNMKSMFNSCFKLEYIDLSNFDASKVTNMNYMFCECIKLRAIQGINTIHTNNVKSMEGMFQLCIELKFINLSNFDTSNVVNMALMFNKCKKLKEIKGLDKFNTSKVADMEGIFQYCAEMECLDLSNFDTSNTSNMAFMFNKCNNLKEIKGINKFKTSNAKTMKSMFQACCNLEKLDLSNFDTSKVENMNNMFYNCNNLKYLNILNFENIVENKNMFMFQNKDKCEFITNNEDLIQLYSSS